MARTMAKQMIAQRKATHSHHHHTCTHTKQQAHPVDLESLDSLERPLFDALTPWFAQITGGQATYTPGKFVSIVNPVISRAVASEVATQVNEHWEHLAKVGVPQQTYVDLLSDTLQQVYADYLPELATEIGKNAKPERFNQARAFGVATTEMTALRALVQIVLIGTYNDLIEMAVQNAG